MASTKTWLIAVVGFVGLCGLGLLALAGAGLYFVSHHFATQKTTSVEALHVIDTSRARFTTPALIEVDSLDRPREARSFADLPTAPVPPTKLNLLAWNPEEGRLVSVSVPFWLVRMSRRKLGFLDEAHGPDLERMNFDVAELERIGPALVLDYRAPSGERVLIWTQ